MIKNQILLGRLLVFLWYFDFVLLQEFLDLALLTRCEGWKLLGCIDQSLEQLSANLAEGAGQMAQERLN